MIGKSFDGQNLFDDVDHFYHCEFLNPLQVKITNRANFKELYQFDLLKISGLRSRYLMQGTNLLARAQSRENSKSSF